MNGTDRRKKAAEMYQEGYSVHDICAELGFTSPEYVRTILKDLGVWPEQMYDIDVPKVLALRKAGWHMSQILDEFRNQYTAKQIMEAVERWDRCKRKNKYDKKQS